MSKASIAREEKFRVKVGLTKPRASAGQGPNGDKPQLDVSTGFFRKARKTDAPTISRVRDIMSGLDSGSTLTGTQKARVTKPHGTSAARKVGRKINKISTKTKGYTDR